MHAHVDDLGRIHRAGRRQLETAQLGQHAERVPHIAGEVGLAAFALERAHTVLLGDHVVGELSFDHAAQQQIVPQVPLVLPQLDGVANVSRDPALDALVKGHRDGAEQRHVHGELVVIEEHLEIADA